MDAHQFVNKVLGLCTGYKSAEEVAPGLLVVKPADGGSYLYYDTLRWRMTARQDSIEEVAAGIQRVFGVTGGSILKFMVSPLQGDQFYPHPKMHLPK